jgi:hypothetical protein
VQGLLHAAWIERRGGQRGAFQTAGAVGKEKHRVTMELPEASQACERRWALTVLNRYN